MSRSTRRGHKVQGYLLGFESSGSTKREGMDLQRSSGNRRNIMLLSDVNFELSQTHCFSTQSFTSTIKRSGRLDLFHFEIDYGDLSPNWTLSQQYISREADVMMLSISANIDFECQSDDSVRLKPVPRCLFSQRRFKEHFPPCT